MLLADGAAPPAGERRVRRLRRCYRIGAAVDAIATLEMLWPGRFDVLGRYATGMDPTRPEFRYGMRTAASLMAAWTALLVWAERRPVERRGVLLLTNVVIAGLMANDRRAQRAGLLSGRRVAPVRALQTGLLALFTYSYVSDARLRTVVGHRLR